MDIYFDFTYKENIIINCDIPLYYNNYPLNKTIEINEKNDYKYQLYI